MARLPKSSKQIGALKHSEATRRNIPTAEMESFFQRDEDSAPRPPKHYARARPLAEGETRTAEEPRSPELIWNGARITITDEQMATLAQTGTLTLSDAQLVWRGKDRQDWSDLVVNVPPLYIQEKIHPKAIIDDLKRRTAQKREAETDSPDLFADFNGITPEQRAEFYQHDQHWSNRMILGDSLQVMASLAERESLKGKVQCIYFDPPYGVKFNSNWQVSTLSKDVKDGKQTDISREPEQVKAFRDTWKDGIHSYLTYLRDRLTTMHDLLADGGSIFVQISDENVHRVRGVLDEVFGESCFVSQIAFLKTTGLESVSRVASAFDYILWFGKTASIKYRKISLDRSDASQNRFKTILFDDGRTDIYTEELERDLRERSVGFKVVTDTDLTKPGPGAKYSFQYNGQTFQSGDRWWGTRQESLARIGKANRLIITGKGKLRFARSRDDTTGQSATNLWDDIGGAVQSRTDPKIYVVQTGTAAIQRCILMTTDPGDLVLDPTCGSGTTAYVAEQWGRRWITMDTSRVALALARTRLIAARYPWYLLADSREGRAKEAELTKRPSADTPVHNDIRQGFVYEREPHIMLSSIANNPLIDDIWGKFQEMLEPLRTNLNDLKGKHWQEWEIPRAAFDPWTDVNAKLWVVARSEELSVSRREDALLALNKNLKRSFKLDNLPEQPGDKWDEQSTAIHAEWWQTRIARQREIDASIAARADVEYLYDKPYTDNARVRVAGPFTVESLSPHRVLPASEDELLGDAQPVDASQTGQDFSAIVIDYLKSEGVKQERKNDRITFESLTPWPGNYIGATGTFIEGGKRP